MARPHLDAVAARVLGDSAARERIVWTPLFGQDHLRIKALATLQLDTYVYCGHTSGADNLWAGVPTLTLGGIKQSSRVGASLLRGLSLHTYLVARTLADYLAVAAAALTRRGWLGRVRRRLERAKAAAPLFDTLRWTGHMETGVRMVWELQVGGLTPRHVVIHRGRH